MEDKKIKYLLDRFLDQLIQANEVLPTLLNEGLSQGEVDEKISGFPIRFPEEVYDLYAWKNGLDEEASSLKTNGEIQFFPLGIFNPLEISIESYEYYAMKSAYWPKYMFPLFDSGGGDYHLIDCNNESETFKMIWYFSNSLPHFDGFVTKYDSLNNLVYSTLTCFWQRAYSYRPANPEDFADGPVLEVDYDLQAKICKEINPKSDYWKMFN